MYRRNDIILAVDYHDNNITVRWFNCYTGEERILRCSTLPGPIGQLVDNAVSEAAKAGGQVIWIMESTTGWGRLKKLIGSKVHFIVANVLQILLPPKAYRRKTDKIDTKRILREFLNPSFASWACLLCNIGREILYWISRLAMFRIKRSAHSASKNIHAATCR